MPRSSKQEGPAFTPDQEATLADGSQEVQPVKTLKHNHPIKALVDAIEMSKIIFQTNKTTIADGGWPL